MKRSPLKRKSRLKPRRSAPRKSGRVRWPEYLDEVRQLPCYVCGKPGPSDPDHQGPHPYGRKADDDTAVPMDRDCHRRRTDGYLPVGRAAWRRALSKEEMRAWCDRAIRSTQAIVLPILAARNVKNPKEEP